MAGGHAYHQPTGSFAADLGCASARSLYAQQVGPMPLAHDELIARIYEAAALPELWPGLLDHLAHRVGARGGTLSRPRDQAPLMIYSPGIADLAAGWVAGGYHLDNQRAAPLEHINHAGFVTDLDMHDEHARQTMQCYADYLTPAGADLGAGTCIASATGDRLILTIEAFADADTLVRAVPELDALRPHLARAAVLSAELQLRASDAAVEALSRAGTAAAMLGGHGQVIAANALFLDQLNAQMFDGRDRLHLVDRAADTAFAAALGALIADGVGSSIAIRDDLGVGLAALHLLPVRRTAHDLFSGATAIAIVARPANHAAPDAGLIQALFDLTPAEARVARAIAAGVSIDDIARSSQKSPETVRSHLKRVYSKTSTGRQNELALLLTGFSVHGG